MSRRYQRKAGAPRREKTPRRKPKVLVTTDGRKRTIYADGTETRELSPETVEMLEEQKQRFIEKFGREPGPHDPIFFDPDEDEPRHLHLETVFDKDLIPSMLGILPPERHYVAFVTWVDRRIPNEELRGWMTPAELQVLGDAADEYEEGVSRRWRLFHVLFEVERDYLAAPTVTGAARVFAEAERLGIYDLLAAYNEGRYYPRFDQVYATAEEKEEATLP